MMTSLLAYLFALTSFFNLVVVNEAIDGGFVDFSHHDHNQLSLALRRMELTYSDIAHMYTIGQSVRGMW